MITVCEPVFRQARLFFYNSFDQLIRENNKALDKTFLYSYNGIGGISSVSEYDYTTSTPSGTPVITSYTYDGTQVDRLASFGGKAITYDANGCVKTYDGWTYTWTLGRLTSMKKPAIAMIGAESRTYTFTYDAYGRRTQKKYTYTPGSLTQVDYIKAETTSYTYDNSGRLVNERCVSVYDDNSTETHEFTYLYDESGIVGAMFSKNGVAATPYYYRRNLQGDVTAIYDQNGVRKAEYAYDAWGNCTVTYSGDYNIAYSNPILYRGYYFDRSTGLYYLNARYYNPLWRRFISPDSTEYLDPESVNGLNLYAYCNNDPVNYADPSGNAPWWSWALSGLQLLVGSVMFFVPGMQTLGFSLVIGGATGLMMNALDSRLVQLIGGANSVANGRGAASVGISLMSLGGWASVAGIGLFVVGIATMILGANEMVAAITGNNYLQRGLGMSDTTYAWAYLGLNLVSSVGQTAGSIYRLHATKKTRLGYDNQPNGYRYFNEKGDPFFDFDYPHGNIRHNHWHGWNGPGLTGRTDGEHWSYLELILWMFGGG